MKVLSPTAHGMIDYLTIGLLALAPTLFDLQGTHATACYVLAAGYLVVTLLTDFPLALKRVIPFPIHGWMDLLLAAGLLASPFLFDIDNPRARTLFLGVGAMLLVVWFLTDWRAQTNPNTNQNRVAGLT